MKIPFYGKLESIDHAVLIIGLGTLGASLNGWVGMGLAIFLFWFVPVTYPLVEKTFKQ